MKLILRMLAVLAIALAGAMSGPQAAMASDTLTPETTTTTTTTDATCAPLVPCVVNTVNYVIDTAVGAVGEVTRCNPDTGRCCQYNPVKCANPCDQNPEYCEPPSPQEAQATSTDPTAGEVVQ